jgi:CHAT domain-containing protein
MWSILDSRLADPLASAHRTLQQCLNVQHDTEQWPLIVRKMDDLALAQLGRLAFLQQAKLLVGAVNAELDQRGLLAINPEVPSLDKLQKYSELAAEFNAIMSAHSSRKVEESIDRFQSLADQIEALVHLEPLEYLHADTCELLASVHGIAGNWQKGRDNILQAKTCLELAIAAAERIVNIPQQAKPVRDLDRGHRVANAYRLQLAELLFARFGQFDTALADLLTIRQVMAQQRVSLKRVNITHLLAKAYNETGDEFQAREMLGEMKSDLNALEFDVPNLENMNEIVSQWVRSVDRSTCGPIEFRRVLNEVFATHLSLLQLQSLIDDENLRESQNILLNKISEVHQQILQKDKSIQLSEQQYLAAVGLTDPAVPAGNDTGPDVYDQQKLSLFNEFSQLVEMVETEQVSAASLAEARALEQQFRGLSENRMANNTLGLQGEMLLQLGHAQEAESALQQASAELIDGGWLDDSLKFLTKLTLALASRGDHAATSSVCGRAIALIEAERNSLSPVFQQATFIQQKGHFYFLGVFSAYKQGDFQLMLERMELSKARASVRALRQAHNAESSHSPQQLEQEIRDLARQLPIAEVPGILRERQRVLWDLLMIQRAKSNRDLDEPEFSLHQVQQLLKTDDAILYYYWLQPCVLLVAAIDHDRIQVERSILSEVDYQRLIAFAEAFPKGNSPELQLDGFLDFAAKLIPENIREGLTGKRRLFVSPHRVLHLFPFHALKIEDDYLIERHAVVYIPNLNSLMVQRKATAADASLAVGTLYSLVPEASNSLLYSVPVEVQEITELYTKRGFAADLFLDEQASNENLRSAVAEGKLATYRILHFAMHGKQLLSETPMEACLYTYDGILDGFEISNWHLNAEVVALSACHTGQRAFRDRSGHELVSDEMFGLQNAFFTAGAHSVVATLWEANDESARRIMVDFHRYLAEQPAEFALQSALRDFIKTAPIHIRITVNWAPFSITQFGQKPSAKA